MIDINTCKWFLRGFILTSLLMLAVIMVVRPTLGWAQGGDEENPNVTSQAADDTPSYILRSDDPAGRVSVAVADTGELPSNQESFGLDGPPSYALRSDDPLGRVRVTVADSAELRSNQEATSVDDTPSYTFRSDNPADSPAEVGTAGDITAQSYTSPLVIPAADFTDDGANDAYFFLFTGGYVQGGFACVMAPAYLPNGVTVTDIFVSVYDNTASGNINIELRRIDNFAGGAADTMASVATTNSGVFAGVQTLNDSSVSNPVVSYPTYSYYITGCLDDSNIRLYSVRIYYTGP